MDVSSPLRSLIPTLDSSVLEVLVGTESGMGVSQIARLADRGTRQGLTLALDRLVDHGIVLADPANRGSLYRLNPDHVLAPAIIAASRSRITFLARLGEEVDQLIQRPVHVSIFGSFARRDGGVNSDIDVLFVLSDEVTVEDSWFEQVRMIGERVRLWTGNHMEYLAYTKKEINRLASRGEPIVDSWLRDAVMVSGEPLESILSSRSKRNRAR